MNARDDFPELYRMTIGVGVDYEDAEAQADQALNEIDRLRQDLDDEYEITKRLRAELGSLDKRLTLTSTYMGLHCCQDRSCGCYDGRAFIEHLQEAYDELSDEAQEMRERWRACVDRVEAARLCLNDEATRVYVARSAHAHFVTLAEQYGFSKVVPNLPWAEVPQLTRDLMVTAAGHMLRDLLDRLDLGRNP